MIENTDILRMNEEGVFKKMFLREYYRGKVTHDQKCALVLPDAAGQGVTVEFMTYAEMKTRSDYPILGYWTLGEDDLNGAK